MEKRKWKSKIKSACKKAGTYQPFFDPVIDTLAAIMENRDNAQEKFDAMGGQTVVKHTNKGGNTNVVKNPALVVLNECNAQALQYWKELGLTSRSYREIHKSIPTTKKSALEEALIAMSE